jgi:hypothetical protein
MFLVVEKKVDYLEYLYYLCVVMYLIVKMIKQNTSEVTLPVVLLNSEDEVMEFDTFDEAEKIRSIFEKNSDSGYKYTIKKV